MGEVRFYTPPPSEQPAEYSLRPERRHLSQLLKNGLTGMWDFEKSHVAGSTQLRSNPIDSAQGVALKAVSASRRIFVILGIVAVLVALEELVFRSLNHSLARFADAFVAFLRII